SQLSLLPSSQSSTPTCTCVSPQNATVQSLRQPSVSLELPSSHASPASCVPLGAPPKQAARVVVGAASRTMVRATSERTSVMCRPSLVASRPLLPRGNLGLRTQAGQ